MQPGNTKQFDWSGNMEQLEERLFMTGDAVTGFLGGELTQHSVDDSVPSLEQHAAVEDAQSIQHFSGEKADFWINPESQEALEQELGRIEQSLSNAHDQSGMTSVRETYGLKGGGQTVAVIDSGIAYDHFALGGGLGENYRVVGGWDFTGEDDYDPYDDGGAGSHGTHVSGIIGASGGEHEGVAPDVDLVGLRVFDDAGNGYFSWVEDALQWVHDNRNAFENPITTVNLSLGVASWNADTIPNWANLEDEFAQLEADGIFIAVSAGNSFSSFGEAGLSYPAASEYVIPVASVDDDGSLSYFSQRNQRVIAAPGRGIMSTVPDYAGNNNGITDDYASFSGTSMASPYVAGASVIIREAMEFVGQTNITQDTIYDHMIATSDQFYDSATGETYNRLNLDSAISALMPTDDFGSTIAAAFSLGDVADTSSVSGAITTLDDVDFFKFTATNSGTVTFTASNLTHNVDANWSVSGGTGAWSGDSNEILTIDVVAGQEYTVGFSSADGLGYYDLDITAESSFSFVDWGSVSSAEVENVSVAGETWFKVAANSDGYFTTEAMFDANGNQVTLELYDSNMELVDTGNAVDGVARVDYYASAGEEMFLKVVGTSSDVDFRLTNLVSVDGSIVNVSGTVGDDTFIFAAGDSHVVSVNGVEYSFDAMAVTEINFDGGAGSDSITVTGGAGDETAYIRSASLDLIGSDLAVYAENVEEKVVLSGGGSGDFAYLYDTYGDEIYNAYADRAVMEGSGFRSEAVGFATTWAFASLGSDTANLHDGATDDRFVAGKDYGLMVSTTGEFFNYATGFDSITGMATAGGEDYATLHGSAGDEHFVGRSDQSEMTYDGGGYSNSAAGFEKVFAYSNGGTDTAELYDAATDDLLIATDSSVVLLDKAGSHLNYTNGFSRVDAYASTGNDTAYLYDGAGDDQFVSGDGYAIMSSGDGSFYNSTVGFGAVFAIASEGGEDTATFHDSSGDDVYTAHPTYAVMTNENQTFYNQATGFEQNLAYSSNGGDDTAFLHGGVTDDRFTATSEYAELTDTSNSYISKATGFGNVTAYGGGGNNTANLYDGATDDLFVAGPQWGVMLSVTGEFYNYAAGFQEVTGHATGGGEDFATFYDSSGDDTFTSGFGSSVMEDNAGSYRSVGNGFKQTYAFASSGTDTAVLRDSTVDDVLFGRDDYVHISNGEQTQYAQGFDTVRGELTSGGDDAVDVESTEYVFDQIGAF